MLEKANYFQYNWEMPETKKRSRSGSPHPPGYWRTYKRPNPRHMTINFTDAEFEMLTRRAEQDGTTRHAAAKTLLLHYAKNGITNG
jgi:hypothetical protein